MPPKKKIVKRRKIVKVAAIGPEVFPCYVFHCEDCKKYIDGSGCGCDIEFGRQKTIHYRGLCKPCNKKSKAV